MDVSRFLRSFFSCATILVMLVFLQAGAALAESSDTSATGEEPNVINNIERDAERVGDKAGELGDSIGKTADGVAESVATQAEKAYEWTKQKGSDAYDWSKKQLHDLTN